MDFFLKYIQYNTPANSVNIIIPTNVRYRKETSSRSQSPVKKIHQIRNFPLHVDSRANRVLIDVNC